MAISKCRYATFWYSQGEFGVSIMSIYYLFIYSFIYPFIYLFIIHITSLFIQLFVIYLFYLFIYSFIYF